MSRQFLLKTFIAGTERSPLPEEELAGPGLEAVSDPAQAALKALVAGNLLRKAGVRLAVPAKTGTCGWRPYRWWCCCRKAGSGTYPPLEGGRGEVNVARQMNRPISLAKKKHC